MVQLKNGKIQQEQAKKMEEMAGLDPRLMDTATIEPFTEAMIRAIPIATGTATDRYDTATVRMVRTMSPPNTFQ